MIPLSYESSVAYSKIVCPEMTVLQNCVTVSVYFFFLYICLTAVCMLALHQLMCGSSALFVTVSELQTATS